MTRPERITAPFTTDQVVALNRWQACNWTHSFTCRDHRTAAHVAYAEAHGDVEPGALIAARRGWYCPVCGCEQNWAHRFMLELPARPPWITEAGQTP